MTQEQLQAIRARCEAASPAPWAVGSNTAPPPHGKNEVVNTDRIIVGRVVYEYHNPDEFDAQTFRDIEFIANARQDIPALLAALEAAIADMTAAVYDEPNDRSCENGVCGICKHGGGEFCLVDNCTARSRWQWRGVQGKNDD